MASLVHPTSLLAASASLPSHLRLAPPAPPLRSHLNATAHTASRPGLPSPSSTCFRILRQTPGDARIVARSVQQGGSETAPAVKTFDADCEEEINRQDFPVGFTFGVAGSCLQIEGAVSEGARGHSIWDTFARIPGKISDGSLPDVACDHYHKYIEDIELIKSLGVDAFRFSISWPRLFPDGSGQVNREGIAFYNSLIDHCIGAGLVPYATVYHWDLPHALENDPKVQGWRTKNIIKHYVQFAEACFRYFGDRVKHWITFNEVHIFSTFGWGTGKSAPGRCSKASGNSCPAGDSSTEPYIVAHNALLSHAAAVKIYRTEYQKEQKGVIGFTADSQWYEPYSSSKEDIDAAQRYLEFETGWQLDPLFTGDYPKSMRERVGERLPKFTHEESTDLKGSVDFIGINYYTANYVKSAPEECDLSKRWWANDMLASITTTGPDGKPIGQLMGPPQTSWLYNCPWGLKKLLAWHDQRYGKVPIYITENGTIDTETYAPLAAALHDQPRITYMRQHLESVRSAIREEEVEVKGYFVWSAMDDWEWASGFTFRFGLVYVDFEDGERRRYPKASAEWYKRFLSKVKIESAPK